MVQLMFASKKVGNNSGNLPCAICASAIVQLEEIRDALAGDEAVAVLVEGEVVLAAEDNQSQCQL